MGAREGASASAQMDLSVGVVGKPRCKGSRWQARERLRRYCKMSSNNSSSKVVTVDEQALKQADGQAVDEDGFPVVDETPEFEATVEQEVQAKVDANHPDGIVDTDDEQIYGATLEQEERIRAREDELERISAQAEIGTQEDRAKRTRTIAANQNKAQRVEFRNGRQVWTQWRTRSRRIPGQNSRRSSWRP